MEKLKRGVITGLQAIGIFFLSLFVYAFYPQNTVMSWICLIITIAIVYVFIRKSKRFAIGLLILYLLVGILVFWLTGGLSEYSCAAEPPVQCNVSHLSRRSEPQ